MWDLIPTSKGTLKSISVYWRSILVRLCHTRKKYFLSEINLESKSIGYLKHWFNHILYRRKKVVSGFSPTKVNFNPNFILLQGIDDDKIERGYSLHSIKAKAGGKDLSKQKII